MTLYAQDIPFRSYSDAVGTVIVAIRTHRVNVVVTGPAPVPEDGVIPISIEWTDIDTGATIGTGVLDRVEVTKISGGTTVGLPYTNWTHLSFYIDATGWDTGTFRLNVSVYSSNPNYADGWGPVNVIIRMHSITADVDAIPRVPIGNNATIILRVNDSDLVVALPVNHIVSVVITGGPSTITLDNTNWDDWVTNGTQGLGTYEIILDVSSWGLNTYSLQFSVTTSNQYGNGIVNTKLTIRSLAISFTYQSPPVVPWGEDGHLVVKYVVNDPTAIQDEDSIEPPGITISISGLTRYSDFDWVYWVNGQYNITFYSSYLTLVQTYNFDITISKSAEFDNGELFTVPLTVRKLFTWLHPTSVPITPYGDNVEIEVEYIVLDGESSMNGNPIHTGSETITVIGLDGFSPTLVSWEWDDVLEVYRIIIDASEVTIIQEYKIMISISGAGVGYQSDTIPELPFSVRTVFTAMTVEPVDAQAYLDNFTIRITYTVNDPDSSINTAGINNSASIIELVEYPGLYSVIEIGNGVYDIIFNSTELGAPSSYLATINTDWTQSPPQYAIQTKGVTLIVTTRPTDIRNTITGEYGYLDEIIVNFTFSDSLRSEWITNTSYGGNHVLLVLYNETSGLPIPNDAWYVLNIVSGTDAFQLRIDADYFGAVNRFFDFKLEVSWEVGTAPYFVSQEFEFRAYVVGQRTNVIIQPGEVNTPYYSDIIITFRFVTEQGHSINESDWSEIDVTVLCEQLPSWGIKTLDWDYFYIPGSSGYYEIQINSTRLAGVGSYTFFINVTYPDELPPFFESQDNVPVSRGVRYIDTFLEYIDPGPLYAGDDLYMLVRYTDLDNSRIVIGLTKDNFIITGGTLQGDPLHIGSGWWEFIIDTSTIPAGEEFTLWIFANQSYHYWQNISAPVYIYEVPLDITLESPSVIERFYGELPYPILRITVRIGAGSLVGNAVTNALIEGFWDQPTLIGWNNELNGTYWIEVSSLYDKDRYHIEVRASSILGTFSNDTAFVTFTITAGPSVLTTYQCSTSFILYPPTPYFIAVNYSTIFGDPITGATVTWSSADLTNATYTLNEILPGIYRVPFDSTGYGIFIYTIDVKATTPGGNVQSQTLTFQIDVRFTPAEIQPENDNYFITVEYFGTFYVLVYFNDTLNNQPIDGDTIRLRATWSPLPLGHANLTRLGGGWYNYSFPATLAAGFTYSLHLDFTEGGSYDVDRATLTIQILPRPTAPVEQWGLASIRDQWNKTINTLQVPVGDWLFIYLNYTDIQGQPIPNASGLVRVGDVSVEGAFSYDSTSELYIVMLDASLFGRGVSSLRVTISKDNFESAIYTTNFEVISIPMELSVEEIDGIPVGELNQWNFYLGTQVSILLYLNDTWHNEPINDATLTIPQALNSSGFIVIPLGDGYYEIQGTFNIIGSNILGATSYPLTVIAVKTQPLTHETTILTDWAITAEPHPTLLLAVYGGAGAAIALIFILMGWILWARVLSIPWEVRRMRKLAKTIEKDETYKLSGKDRKHFHERGVLLESKVDSAMSPIGVSVTPAMIPTVEEVEEITATEEDIMTELDKIPGLGPEEKAVLAEEMRKIPRKDRIWFLDDLRRQMGQRRMDFLTQRDEPPTPKAPPEPTPEDVPPPDEKAPALEEVKPEEPPPAITEDRTAPTVLPPDLQPVPAGDPAVIAEIRRELSKIPGLSEEEKDALVDHLQYLSKEERQSTYRSLKMSANSDEK